MEGRTAAVKVSRAPAPQRGGLASFRACSIRSLVLALTVISLLSNTVATAQEKARRLAKSTNNKNNRRLQTIGVDICACQPATYEFRLDFGLSCANTTVQGHGITDKACVVNPDINQNVTNLVPAFVSTIQILELNQGLKVISQTPIQGPFVNGDTFRYTSIISSIGPNPDPSSIPKGLQITIAGRNAQEQELVNFWLIVFDNKCGVFPLLLKGEEIGWTIFTNLGVPPYKLCPAAPKPVTVPPSTKPIIPPNIRPTSKPSTAPPKNTPTLRPITNPPIITPTTTPPVVMPVARPPTTPMPHPQGSTSKTPAPSTKPNPQGSVSTTPMPHPQGSTSTTTKPHPRGSTSSTPPHCTSSVRKKTKSPNLYYSKRSGSVAMSKLSKPTISRGSSRGPTEPSTRVGSASFISTVKNGSSYSDDNVMPSLSPANVGGNATSSQQRGSSTNTTEDAFGYSHHRKLTTGNNSDSPDADDSTKAPSSATYPDDECPEPQSSSNGNNGSQVNVPNTTAPATPANNSTPAPQVTMSQAPQIAPAPSSPNGSVGTFPNNSATGGGNILNRGWQSSNGTGRS